MCVMCAPECVSCFLPRPVEPPCGSPHQAGSPVPLGGAGATAVGCHTAPSGQGRATAGGQTWRAPFLPWTVLRCCSGLCTCWAHGWMSPWGRSGHISLRWPVPRGPRTGRLVLSAPPTPARASPAAAGGPWAPCASSPGAALSSAGFAEHLLTCPCLTLLLSLAHQPEASLRGAEAGRKGPRSDGGLGWRPSCQSHPRGAAFHGTWPHTRVAIVCCWNFVLISTGSRSSPHICRASRRWAQVRRLRS